ncbi:hypothetical protein BC834DRAFT_815519 [Gloeopeniophorella convolvens]|nr:hypothetical protein BC834DRAFT_815519 [Gloeopeniophorella convolvens]
MPPRRAPRQQQQKQRQSEPPKAPGLVRDPEVTYKVMEYVLDGPNGKRTLSRLARVCKSLVEPGLGLLWKELDNLVPLISLFPNHLFKRAKRPGLGLAETPAQEDWSKVLQYGERVRRLTYDESSKSVSPSIFPILEEHRPRTYILPNLTTLVWRVETAAGLDRINLFLNPELQNLTLEIGARLPQLGTVLADISRRTKLAALSVTSLVPLPDDLPQLLASQTELDKLSLLAPAASSPAVGRWAASLPRLRALQLDLTGRSPQVAAEFFKQIGVTASGSGISTPNSVASRDSGVFSGEDIDFTEIKKAMKKARRRGTVANERGPIIGAFTPLRILQLTGEVPTILAFLRNISSPLTQLELIIEDPFGERDWRALCILISQYFGNSLQSLKVSASGASRFNDLVRTTSRGEAVSRRLSLEGLSNLLHLTKLDIDLPESVIIQNSDVSQVGEACPNLEILRLCPTARFPIAGGPPSLTLDGLAPLTARCRGLETLAVVVNADEIVDPQMYLHPIVSSRTLLKLHLGHSWVRDPLVAAIALSHLAPHADTLRWFHEKNRPGFIETHALGWQRVAEMLPPLQDLRLTERWVAGRPELPEPRLMFDQAVDATPELCNRVVQAAPQMASSGTQAAPETAERAVVARPRAHSIAIDATPAFVSTEVDAVPPVVEEAVMASPTMVSQEIEAVAETAEESVDAVPEYSETMYIDESEAEAEADADAASQQQAKAQAHFIQQLYVPAIVGSAIALAWKTMVFGPNFVTARMQDVWSMTPFHASKTHANVAGPHEHEKVVEVSEEEPELAAVSEKAQAPSADAGVGTDIVPVCI